MSYSVSQIPCQPELLHKLLLLDFVLCNMHNACMATKTISLKMEAYNKLRSARRYPDESFSEVVLRASWPEETITARELLELCRERGPVYTTEMVERVETLNKDDEPAEDKWESR